LVDYPLALDIDKIPNAGNHELWDPAGFRRVTRVNTQEAPVSGAPVMMHTTAYMATASGQFGGATSVQVPVVEGIAREETEREK